MEPIGIFFISLFSLVCCLKGLNKIKTYKDKKMIKKVIYKEKIKLSKKKLEELHKKEENECIICYEDYKVGDKVKILYCDHMYHKKCIKRWFKESIKCPLCNLAVKTNYKNLRFDEYINFIVNNNE